MRSQLERLHQPVRSTERQRAYMREHVAALRAKHDTLMAEIARRVGAKELLADEGAAAAAQAADGGSGDGGREDAAAAPALSALATPGDPLDEDVRQFVDEQAKSSERQAELVSSCPPPPPKYLALERGGAKRCAWARPAPTPPRTPPLLPFPFPLSPLSPSPPPFPPSVRRWSV